jgi:hypothetical protein
VELEGDGEQLEQFDEDHTRRAQRHVIDDKDLDVVSGGEDATAEETTGGTAAAQRGDAAAALRTR